MLREILLKARENLLISKQEYEDALAELERLIEDARVYDIPKLERY